MTVHYIYNHQGQIEYAILSVDLWQTIQTHLPAELADKLRVAPPAPPKFDPKLYYGLLAPLQLNVEAELKQMRQGWNKNF
jgi:hypothetical protein